jgi:hypothetical protein
LVLAARSIAATDGKMTAGPKRRASQMTLRVRQPGLGLAGGACPAAARRLAQNSA